MKRIAVLLAVIAAMALGRVITDWLPVSKVNEEPFDRPGKVGQTIALRYADIEVPEVGVASEMSSSSLSTVRKPGGVFVVVPMAVTATEEPLPIRGARLRDVDGIEYISTPRTGCARSVNSQTGVKVWSTVCFDVPAEAVPGIQLVVSAGVPGTPNDNDRDDQAVIDLGLTRADARAPSPRLVGVTESLQRPQLEPSR